ncbi:hypothetical protein GCM10011581_40240 [Saccharopolyspora subtropica]|uniref:DUF2267 domain-containing protein n=1 Tax=Saccharopolyspora thermophila TaxID=89367 RepID=A0A917K667_9PSEU|nr:DUF2267 domain-containing protein [Saccharopolyspora subtropica]GGI98958.1 hypothetical protein GCM10011581_40240 [Saccharopolyspora subtropica]
MTATKASVFDHALHTANAWLHDVAKEFGTDDRQFVHRVLRAWLHTLRDRLTVEATAHFAAQLPELLRGIYYEGWDPSAVPQRYDAAEYASRFARDANISLQDVHRVAPTVTAVVQSHVSPGHLGKVLDQLPKDMRALLRAQA